MPGRTLTGAWIETQVIAHAIVRARVVPSRVRGLKPSDCPHSLDKRPVVPSRVRRWEPSMAIILDRYFIQYGRWRGKGCETSFLVVNEERY